VSDEAVPKRVRIPFEVLANALVAGGLGFEPRLAESESAVLPLNYPPKGPGARTFVSGDLVSGAARRYGGMGPGAV
jgi:hypothetical protein